MPAHCSQDAIFDHNQDERKHGSFSRLDPAPFSEAMEVAIAVKNAPNLHVAAGLIDDYADAKAAAIRLDAVAAGARP
jgi:hypothetical protein